MFFGINYQSVQKAPNQATDKGQNHIIKQKQAQKSQNTSSSKTPSTYESHTF